MSLYYIFNKLIAFSRQGKILLNSPTLCSSGLPSSPSSTGSIWPSLPPSPSEHEIANTHRESNSEELAGEDPLQEGGGRYDDDVTASSDNETRPPGVRFDIIDERERESYVQRFHATVHSITLRIKEPPDTHDNLIIWLELALQDIHAHIISLAPEENSLMGVSVRSDHFLHGSGGLSSGRSKILFTKTCGI